MALDDLLLYAARKHAEYFHISSGAIPALLVDGELLPLTAPPIPPDECQRLLFAMMDKRQRTEFEENSRAYFDYSLSKERVPGFRVTVYEGVGGMAALFRVNWEELS